MGQDEGASCLPRDQGAELKLLHTGRQVGRADSGSGLLSGRPGRYTKETISLDRPEKVTRSQGSAG